ncbi:TetR/AcrR family transcriptional regulator [Actinomadura parmotrematis]|uniref:TetR/AcrR family transcriptional regulator n=1 Tax=Actinomadura parmotrematis TaxID=2864039 RepID=A0ABS7FLX5_9ACTN|nr:TetR/AcrR family transcriptional regulator [Actinomadura parmotrematis]MBW8481387.1 TetR/AcrR family transcriptional regulator [Actinomadura parmotrematis]
MGDTAILSREAQVRGQILDAAAACLVDGGFGSGRLMSAIARRAGMSRPTLYRYYDGFDAVRDALIQREVARLLELLAPMVDRIRWTAEYMTELMTFVVDFARSHPLLVAAVRDIPERVLPLFTTQAQIIVDRVMEIMEPLVTARIEAGLLPPVDVRVSLDLLCRIAMSLIVADTSFDLNDRAALEEYVARAVRFAAFLEWRPEARPAQ